MGDSMDFLSGGNDLGTLGLGLLIAGAAAGLVAGALGRGAGLILVPALFLAARGAGLMPDKAFHLAVGTGFAALLPLSLGLLAGRAPDWTTARRTAAPLAVGVIAGTWIGLVVSPMILVLIFAAVGLGAVALTLAVTKTHTVGPIAAAALLQGALASMLGLSGASFGTPLLSASGLPPDKANATAGLFAVAITAAGAVVAVIAGWPVHDLPRYSYGYVNLMAFAVVAPAAFATSLVAAHYASEFDPKKLRVLFAVIAVFSVVRMVWSVVG
jgi:uncharacterized protein